MSLVRFIEAQQLVYAPALDELRRGRKTTHWMWFIFPQITGLGQSPAARLYAIADRGEAMAYLAHAVLGARLAECTEALMAWAGHRQIGSILGMIDAQKFCSSMTLYEAVGAPFCAAPLEAFYGGERDDRTLRSLGQSLA